MLIIENVNHPEHYNKGLKLNGKPIEAIDVINMFANMEGISGDESFMLGTVIKYLSRFPYKGKRKEDLEKARWYLDKLIKLNDPEDGLCELREDYKANVAPYNDLGHTYTISKGTVGQIKQYQDFKDIKIFIPIEGKAVFIPWAVPDCFRKLR